MQQLREWLQLGIAAWTAGRHRTVRLAATFALASFSSTAFAQTGNNDIGKWIAEYRVPNDFVFYSPLDRGSWKAGFYAGQSYRARLMNAVATPWNTIGTYYNDSYVMAANVVYKMVDLPYLPISVEMDFSANYHGSETYGEFRVTPTFRWKWFPWNNFVYTNVRVGPFGLSYATKITDLERTQVENFHSTKLQNSTVVEWTFAPSESSNWEAFWRIDHRCGVYGFFDGVVGGTNYMTVGFRASF